eukprot:403080_1
MTQKNKSELKLKHQEYIPENSSCGSEWNSQVNYNVQAERVYYVGCVEEDWDYAPSGENLVSGTLITETSPEAKWLWYNGVDRIGGKYIKSLYREFTDDCFTTQQRTESDKHLGALGPNFRALTGETIKVFYKNMCTFDTSIHPHGVSYDKTSEGAPYLDNDGITTGDVVPANGGNWIYIWHARTDMIDQGTSSKMWLYHSHVSTISDIYGGLFGAIIITKQGMETSATNLKPIDIDKEFVTFFVQYDENRSGLFEKNLAKISEGESVRNDQEFIESNQMHALNGYLWNLDHLIMDQNEMVRWYTCSLGDEVDGPHSPHWHANIVVDSLGDHTDTLVLIPGTTYTVTMITESPGIWLYHCHVFDHIAAGMITTYTVNDNGGNNNGKPKGKSGKK